MIIVLLCLKSLTSPPSVITNRRHHRLEPAARRTSTRPARPALEESPFLLTDRVPSHLSVSCLVYGIRACALGLFTSTQNITSDSKLAIPGQHRLGKER